MIKREEQLLKDQTGIEWKDEEMEFIKEKNRNSSNDHELREIIIKW
jgi:hypothetical protein